MVHFPAENTHHAEARPAGQWQPIESAPRDGTRIDLWCRDLETGRGHRFHDSYWVVERQQWHGCDEYIWEDIDEPTHWMQLPAPPSP